MLWMCACLHSAAPSRRSAARGLERRLGAAVSASAARGLERRLGAAVSAKDAWRCARTYVTPPPAPIVAFQARVGL
jgi:hypothetical protein